MQLKGLFQTAFRGCGSSLRAALESPRYAELLAEHKALGDDAQMAALLDLLGETSIDEVVRRDYLPERVRRLAAGWAGYSADEQARACEIVVRELHAQQKGREHVTAEGESGPFLPSAFGGKRKLSCAGIGALLTAFGKLTGARYYLVSVQRMVDEALCGSWLRLATAADEVMTRNLPLAAKFDCRGVNLAKTPEFVQRVLDFVAGCVYHQALAIELKDGRYRLIDPYLQLSAELGREELQAAAGQLEGRPSEVVYLHNDMTAWSQEGEYADWLRGIEDILEQAHSGTILGPEIPLLELPGVLRKHLEARMDADPAHAWPQLLWTDGIVLQAAVVPHSGRSYYLGDKEVERIVRNIQKRGGSLLAATRERILLFLLAAWTNKINYQGIDLDRKRVRHPSIALSNPVRALGLRTILNVRAYARRRRIHIGGALLPHSGALDVVWSNALIDQATGCKLTAHEQSFFDAYTQRLRGMPLDRLHPILARQLAALDGCR